MILLKMNPKIQFQTKLLFVVLLFCVSCDSFKLPVNIKKSFESPRTQLSGESEDEPVSSDINSVSSSPGKPLKFPDASEITDFSAKSKPDENDSLPYYPVLVFNRNGFLDSKYIEETSQEHGAKPRLQRFYKHSAKLPRSKEEMIVFPGQENPSSERETSNEKNPEDYLRFSARAPETSIETGMETPEPPVISEEAKESSSINKSVNPGASKQSLESLAQIVRHLLFRITEPSPEQTTTTDLPHQTSTTPYVSDQSLYTGPKVKPNSDDGCSDGLKKTRNGSCQKPSKRLGTG
ncbi:hypothetical protein Ocin01_05915 [Orchesella cincta]|uniref:Uncharacterized protein n=1 Tax=Orchesella cincta TaxID=48709 RepID=A0A1D2N686_ORCCI|nr:hypothetical protein Ocin01_05915 [Orchesella cincta]